MRLYDQLSELTRIPDGRVRASSAERDHRMGGIAKEGDPLSSQCPFTQLLVSAHLAPHLYLPSI